MNTRVEKQWLSSIYHMNSHTRRALIGMFNGELYARQNSPLSFSAHADSLHGGHADSGTGR
jgi:hypothetical protein